MTICKGLLGECIDCVWPHCESNDLAARGFKPCKAELHPYRHVRRNGTVVYVTAKHRDRLYKRGDMPANYPVPAIPLKVIHGGHTVRWLSICNPITHKIMRYWHPDLTI